MRTPITRLWTIVFLCAVLASGAFLFLSSFPILRQTLYTFPPLQTVSQTPRNLAPNETAQPLALVASEAYEIPGLPSRLRIPEIGVDASIEYVGLTAEGAMEVPKDRDTVAWFNRGARPGEIGSSVINGHSGWRLKLAVFDDLDKLKKGDKIYSEDDKGQTIVFVVREIRMYGKNDTTSDVFSSDDGKSHLNLITCEGEWSKTDKSYSNRLVVFSDREPTAGL